jgi:UDP-N-acetylmuramoylalanine--D-glutamate ligase
MTAADRFFNQLRGKKVALLGIGVTNSGLIMLLHEKGALVTARDRRGRGEFGDFAKTLDELESIGVRLKLGKAYLENLDEDIVFRTPGMSFYLPELAAFRANGGVLTSEMEVFPDVCPCPVIAVTGSDGKTTTSTLIAKILEAEGKTVHLGGNIGRALLPHVFEINEDDFAVVELSSFQLVSMRCAPQISVVTNITPNHLDMHRDMEEYIAAKKNIFAHQNAFSRTVLSLDNEITASFKPEIRGECSFFSLAREVENGAWLDESGALTLNQHGTRSFIMNARDIRLPGRHNIANVLAAICAVAGLARPETVRKVAGEFAGVEHRIEFIRELDGVK